MTVSYLKKAAKSAESSDRETRLIAMEMLARIEAKGEAASRDYARDLDGWQGDIVVSPDKLGEAEARLPESVKEDIRYSHARVRDFARHQRDLQQEFETPMVEGLVAGQRLIPVTTAGCYVPGGRYAHAALDFPEERFRLDVEGFQ